MRLVSLPLLGLAAALLSSLGCAPPEAGGSLSSNQAETPSPFWKHQIQLPGEPLAAPAESDQPSWIKFAIRKSEPTKVYFQDSTKYPFHYDFAKAHLTGFATMTRDEFQAVTLKRQGQTLITGAILVPQNWSVREFGIQLVGDDEYTKEEVRDLFQLVARNIVSDAEPMTALYMPSAEQEGQAQRDSAWLLSNQVPVASPSRWLEGDACYSRGWAFGHVRYIPGPEIKQAYAQGRLTLKDILITDRVPAEVPYVSGIISLSPSTPNSHVAILSQTWGIPFAYPNSEALRQRLKGLDGNEIVVRTAGGPYSPCSVDVIEPTNLDASTRAALSELRKPPAVSIPVKSHLGGLTRPTLNLRAEDARYFGGKASNFGTLRRSIPDDSPNALGVSFDLWDAFLAQPTASGKTLRTEINTRLGAFAFPPDIAKLEAALIEIRALVFATELPTVERDLLVKELQAFGFDARRKLRFRSSTNVEDGAVMSGAGLYDSFSGCLADDLDADSSGPSACDPSEAKEKGVGRAIQKVFASFFNTNAVLERVKYGIAEDNVGMAMAVHYSSPDSEEAANGVAIYSESEGNAEVSLVTQVGAESVTNPTGGALPEASSVSLYRGGSVYARFGTGSSRVPLGGKVMTWDSDYVALAKLIAKASEAFKMERGITGDFKTDLEYKKHTDGKLTVKQIRLVPERGQSETVVPVMLQEAAVYTVVGGSVRVRVSGINGPLTDAARAKSPWSSVSVEIAERGRLRSLAGAPATFPSATHSEPGEGELRDTWTWDGKTYGLHASVPRRVAPAAIPIFVARDFYWSLITPENPESGVGLMPYSGDSSLTTLLRKVHGTGARGLQVRSEYQQAVDAASSGVISKSSQMGRWRQTEIVGLTSQPITLTNWFAQSFVAKHHSVDDCSWGCNFVFTPAYDESVPLAIRQELAQKDILSLVMEYSGPTSPAEGGGTAVPVQFSVVKLSTNQNVPW